MKVNSYIEINLGREYRNLSQLYYDLINEFEEDLFARIVDNENKVDAIIFYYDRNNFNHIPIWKSICNKLNITYIENIFVDIYLCAY